MEYSTFEDKEAQKSLVTCAKTQASRQGGDLATIFRACTSRRAKTRERESRPFENAPGAASSVIGFRQARGARRAARKGGLGHQEPDRGLHVRRAPARGQTSTRVEAAPVGALIGALGTSAIVQRRAQGRVRVAQEVLDGRSTSTEFDALDDSGSNDDSFSWGFPSQSG